MNPTRRRQARLRRWLLEHDHRLSFTVLYISLALVLAEDLHPWPR